MAAELKTNGVEYSPNKSERLNGASGGGGGVEERYRKKDREDGDEERVPLKQPVDVEKTVPVASLEDCDEDHHDTGESVTLKAKTLKRKKKEKMVKAKDVDEELEEKIKPIKGEFKFQLKKLQMF